MQFFGSESKTCPNDCLSARALSLSAIYLLFVQPDHARNHRRPRERKDGIVKNNETGELKGNQQERGLFGVVRDAFRVFARRSSAVLGTAWAFALAILVIAVWAATGPKFHYSDTWQLIINTGTTIVTFLMVFVIQNTQNRDGKAIQLKLDDLIRALTGMRNKLVDL